MNIGIVSSVGGHLSEILQLRPVYGQYPHFYILNDAVPHGEALGATCHVIAHSERDWRVLLNVVEIWRIYRVERPDLVISAGAGPAVPAFVVAGLMGVPRLFIETFAAVSRPSLTGRIIYRLRLYDEFLYQWEGLSRAFPRAKYAGWIYDPRGFGQRQTAL